MRHFSLLLLFFIATAAPAAEGPTEHDVLPIFLLRCSNCHGAIYKEGELDLRSRASILTGGKSGSAIEIGAPEKSLLIEKIAKGEMPPEESHGQAGIEAMTPEELAVIRDWIAAGAPETPAVAEIAVVPETDHWAFQTPVKPPVPTAKNADLAENPIDAFLLANLEAAGLTFSPEADPVTLRRRASFALTGLPPRAEELTIEQLLASPRYGEKWGRVWLDLAGYSDSEGKRHADMIRASAWRYRDYVVRSFNEDKPYDQFLLEQIAGDELADFENSEITQPIYDNLVATGFLRMAPDGTTANPVNRAEDRLEVINDEIKVLAEGVMGLTMECARCHDHKYDPITQRDYYGLLAVFKGAYDEYNWMTPQGFSNQWKKSKQRQMPFVMPDERKKWEADVAEIDAKIEPLKKQVAALAKDAKDEKKKLDAEIKKLEGTKPKRPMIRGLWDRGQPSNAYVMNRGDHTQPAALVQPNVPAVFGNLEAYEVKPPWDGATATGRRLAFAKWLTQAKHPLTARVIVNRVWKQHFGRGIVESLDNFGALGAKPTNQQLLDWLAVSFVENGWSLKWLNREIMNSRAWRQASITTPELAAKDPDNVLVSRMPLRRMDAEEVHDTILLLSGRLDETPFGPPDPVDVRKDGLVTPKPAEEGGKLRRSLYVRQRRKEMPTILEAFDLPAMNPNCHERIDSTVVTQPLHLLNDERVHELAGDFAARLSGDLPARIEEAWLHALNRAPTPDEAALALEAIAMLEAQWRKSLTDGGEDVASLALADFCHTLINSAGFLYID
ncbi:MAG: hypothetical protein ACI8UO_000172 [Verrucomicrobiales bacterium]